MSLYLMHVANDRGIAVDEIGREFEGDELAIAEASRAAGAILADELQAGAEGVSIKIYVEHADKRRVATVSVSGSLTF
jgi:hypothetical protein